MQVRRLAVEGAFELTPRQHADQRGVFLEWFTDPVRGDGADDPLAGFATRQANLSVSAAGVVRGVHFADVPPGQAKHVTCVRGAVLDVVVDLRVGSPTFGRSDAVLLDDRDRRMVRASAGLGHAFCSLADDSTVVYLCSEPYRPAAEHAVHPFDPALALAWPAAGLDGRPLELALSDKDAAAPSLVEARDAGLLPTWRGPGA